MKIEIPQDFGARLQARRDDLGWSGTELAKRARISATTLYALENGNTKPQGATLRRLARAFGVSVEELLSESPLGEHLSQVEAAALLLPLFEKAERVAVERGGRYMVEVSGSMAKHAYRVLKNLWLRRTHGEDVPRELIARWEDLADRCWSRIPESAEPLEDEQIEELLRSVELEAV